MPRTLEIFDMAGLVVPFLEAANRVTSVAVVTHGHRLAQIPFAPPDTPYPFVAMVPQDVTEALLVQALRSRGGEVEYETSFVSASQDGDGVDVVLDHRGERVMVRAAFVVGCDGAHSVVRHQLGLPFEGAPYDATFTLADIDTDEALAATSCSCARTRTARSRSFRCAADAGEWWPPSARAMGMGRRSSTCVRCSRGAPRGLEAQSLNWSSYFRSSTGRCRTCRSGGSSSSVMRRTSTARSAGRA
jgi:2-polyprenyl-6-methoxyphenol hydroxylase-like FAD-dependent oxidoreductase